MNSSVTEVKGEERESRGQVKVGQGGPVCRLYGVSLYNLCTALYIKMLEFQLYYTLWCFLHVLCVVSQHMIVPPLSIVLLAFCMWALMRTILQWSEFMVNHNEIVRFCNRINKFYIDIFYKIKGCNGCNVIMYTKGPTACRLSWLLTPTNTGLCNRIPLLNSCWVSFGTVSFTTKSPSFPTVFFVPNQLTRPQL